MKILEYLKDHGFPTWIIFVVGALIFIYWGIKQYYGSKKLASNIKKDLDSWNKKIQLEKEEKTKLISNNIQEQIFLLTYINNLEINSSRFLLISFTFLLASMGVVQTGEADTVTSILLLVLIIAVALFFALAMRASLQANRNIKILESVRKKIKTENTP